jgi:hypothetical protein
MNIRYTKSYDNTIKKLKRHNKENENNKIIIELIKNSTDFLELSLNPISKMYGFEQLRHELNEFYSFNLCKNGGVIRLIIKPSNLDFIDLVYISYKHKMIIH